MLSHFNFSFERLIKGFDINYISVIKIGLTKDLYIVRKIFLDKLKAFSLYL